MDEKEKPDENPTFINESNEAGSEIDYSEIIGDRYRIVSLLGHGGMGAVFKVEQIFLNQTFALKTLTAKNFTDIAIRRFQKEAQAAGKLTHPNLVRALDFGVLKNGNPFYVMDLVDGDNLAEYTKKTGLLKLEEVFKIFIPICFALGYAHTEGIIHRDIKPGNIMLARTGNPTDPFVPKIVDFGIAKLTNAEDGISVNLTQTGEVFGTPLYMSPEQCFGKNLDSRSDIYSLGCVLYETLTGAPPFTADSALALMMKHQSEEPASMKEASLGREFPANLEKIVMRTLEKDPNHRYQRLEDLASDLANLQLDYDAKINSAPQQTLDDNTRKIEKKSSKNSRLPILQALGLSALFFAIGFAVKEPEVRVVRVPIKMTISEEESEKRFNNLLRLGNTAYVQAIPARHMRVYDFPRQFTSCTFRYIKDGKVEEKSAVGKFDVPEKSIVGLEIPQDILISYPYMLRGFQPNDIQHLRMVGDGNIAWATENSDGAYDVALAYASRMTGLTEIVAHDTTVTDVGIRCIQDLPDLNVVEFSRTQATAEAISRLKSFDQLQILGISGLKGGKNLIPRMAKNKNWVALFVENLNLTDSDVQKFKDAKILEAIAIGLNEKLTDSALDGFISLKQIQLHGTHIRPSIIPKLAAMKNLERVTVDERYWTHADAEKLKKQFPHRNFSVIGMSPDKEGVLQETNWQGHKEKVSKYE